MLLLANGSSWPSSSPSIASRRTKLEALAEEGNRRAQIALDASRELSLQLAGAQLGMTMASLALGFVAEPAVGQLFESALQSIGLPDRVGATSASRSPWPSSCSSTW